MVGINNTIYINVPVERLFNFLSRPENLPLWNYYLKSVRKISNGINIIGARYHQERKDDEQVFEITRFEQNKLIEFKSLEDSKLRFKRQLIFSQIDGQTFLQDFFEVDTGLPLMLQKLFRGKLRSAVKENLAKLKQLLETGQTTLQDGRLVRI